MRLRERLSRSVPRGVNRVDAWLGLPLPGSEEGGPTGRGFDVVRLRIPEGNGLLSRIRRVVGDWDSAGPVPGLTGLDRTVADRYAEELQSGIHYAGLDKVRRVRVFPKPSSLGDFIP